MFRRTRTPLVLMAILALIVPLLLPARALAGGVSMTVLDDWLLPESPPYTIRIQSEAIRADSNVTARLEGSQVGETVPLAVWNQREGYVAFYTAMPLPRGEYTLVASIDGQTVTAPVYVMMVPQFQGLDSNLPASYAARTVSLHGGDIATFAPDSLPQVQILDDNGAVLCTLEVQFVSEKEVQFTIPAGLPSGRYWLKAEGAEWGTTTSTFFVGTREETGQPGQSGTGGEGASGSAAGNIRPAVIKDWNGNPLANVGVHFAHVDEFPVYSRVFWTDDQGRFDLDLGSLRRGEGQYIVHMIQRADGSRILTYLPVQATAQQAEYILQLPRPNVELRIQDERGMPLPNADYGIFDLNPNSPLHNSGVSARTDAEGWAQLYLPPAEYYVQVDTKEYVQPEPPRFVARENGMQEVTVTLLFLNVQGAVTVGGQPTRWPLLKLIGPDGQVHQIQASYDGRFISRLAPGRYSLVEVDTFFREYGIPHYFGEGYPVTVAGVDAPVVINVALPEVNVQGDAVIDGQPVAEGLLLAEPVGADWTLRSPIENGRWQMYLSAGQYRVTGIQVGNRTYDRSELLTVSAEKAPAPVVTTSTLLFPDVPLDHWARADLEALAAQNVVRGDQWGRFNPERAVTRAEFATLLVRTLGLERATPAQPTFPDVAPTDWFYADVEAVARAGLIQGAAGQFRPLDTIARQEMAAILARTLRQRGESAGLPAATAEALRSAASPEAVEAILSGVADGAEVAPWAKADVALTHQLGLLKGRSGSRYEPQASATRLEAVVALKRLLDALGEP